jgi:hypothetical protein
MKIITIQHSNSKEFFQPNGLKEWKGFVVTAEVEAEEDVYHAKQQLVDTVAEWQKDFYHNPGLYVTNTVTGEVSTGAPVKEVNLAHERLEIMIENATSTKELDGYKADVEKTCNSELYISYLNKYQQLLQSLQNK